MTSFENDPFFQYPQVVHKTSAGDVVLPILYYQASNFMAMFFTDMRCAQDVIGDAGFTPIRFGNGKALVGVAFYEYRQTSIGAYNEVGVAIAATPQGVSAGRMPLLSLFRHPDNHQTGFHVIDLPVTTAAACAAGREIWGYPKFVTEISFSLKGRTFSGAVMEPHGSGEILELSGKTGPCLPAPLISPILFSTIQGRTLRTTAITRGGGRLCLPGSIRLRVSDSQHRMAKNLRRLGLNGRKPAFVTCTDRFQLRLNAGATMPRVHQRQDHTSAQFEPRHD